MEQPLYPVRTKEISQKRKDLAPETLVAFQTFTRQVFADGPYPEKPNNSSLSLVAHMTECPYCIRNHTKQAMLKGATEQEIMEAICVAAEIRGVVPSPTRPWPSML